MEISFSLRSLLWSAAVSVCFSSCQLPQQWVAQLPGIAQPTVKRALPSREGVELFRRAVELNVPQQASGLNDTARVLAGMEPSSGRGHDIRSSTQWQNHKAKMDELWKNFEWRHAQPIGNWAGSQINDLRSASAVFYPFSGPDVLFAHHFFPSAETLVLCGLEPCEPLPPLTGLSEGEIAQGLDGLATSLNTVMQFSFFITKDMRQDLVSTRFRGVLPVMLAFLSRTGHSVESVEQVRLSAEGVPVLAAGGNGVMIRARTGWGAPKRVFYFRQDLSDSGTSAGSPLLRFVSSMGQPPAFVKSASYLMHEGGFGNIRRYLQQSCSAIVQDPSGVPYRELLASGHDLRLYGNYQGTIDMFSEHQQPDLIQAYASGQHAAQPIGFGVGYVFNADRTCLMVARRR